MGGDYFVKNLQNVCRACLCEVLIDNEINLVPILTRKKPLLKLLLAIAPELNVTEGGGLPTNICLLCAKKLTEAYNFQQMCLRAERQLREWLKNQKLTEVNNNIYVNKATGEPLSYNTKTTKDYGEGISTEKLNESQAENIQVNNFRKNKSKTKDEMMDVEYKDNPCNSSENSNIYFTNDNPISNEVNDTSSCNLTSDQCRDKYSVESLPTIHKQNENLSEGKTFACIECGHTLKTLKSLRRHQQIHQRSPEEMKNFSNHRKNLHQCKFCPKVFQQSCTLKDHLRVHTGEQPFLCSECGKAFKNLSNMKQHLLRHSGDKRYECPECPKKFPCISDLSSHKAVHNKIKSNVCDICGSAFTKPCQLRKHKMYHSGERPHKCEYCDMRFVLAHQKRRHLRTHTGEKPYQCKYCHRAFTQSNDLVKHLRNHLGDNIYKCELCPQAFRLIKDLRLHFAIHKKKGDEAIKNDKRI